MRRAKEHASISFRETSVAGNRAILLIEDNPSDIELTKRALKRGHIASEIIVAEDGEEALDYLFGTGRHAGHDPPELPAIVLLDLKLPKISGLEVLRRIRAHVRTRRLPVIILTTSREDEDLGACYDHGANSYVVKPVDFSRFQRAIEQLGSYWLVINEAPPDVKES
jgi:CheY-like chemotaxis protein